MSSLQQGKCPRGALLFWPVVASCVEVSMLSSASNQLMRSEQWPGVSAGHRSEHKTAGSNNTDIARRDPDPAKSQAAHATIAVSPLGEIQMHKPTPLVQDQHMLASSINSSELLLPSHPLRPDGSSYRSKSSPHGSAGHTAQDQNSEAAATPVRQQHSHDKAERTDSSKDDLEFDMVRLGDGVGTLTYDKSAVGSRELNRELRRRLTIQDAATIWMLTTALVLVIWISCISLYQFSEDPSPILFYTDPKHMHQRLVCATADHADFLRAFNLQPQTARLRIVGKRPENRSFCGLCCSGRHREARQRFSLACHDLLLRVVLGAGRVERLAQSRPWDPVVFDVALDLSPFIAGPGWLRSEADLVALQQHLNSSNPWEIVALSKRVEWSSWEDVATNVRQRLRSLGFSGEVDVRFEALETVLIYRNHRLQNFIRSHVTHFLMLLTVVGYLFWLPYTWVRKRTVKIEACFQINLQLERYWQILSDGLHASEGFQG
mmetsp:Transcript_8410/g.15795  ORF Transcript_8410/g.15795 Transcript_8410/m.15795 type:complete len:490 (-) Transcript_8410:81-1550(-)